ncbi:MAG: hypothetical protein ACI4IE_04680 [Eubacterium sp.]
MKSKKIVSIIVVISMVFSVFASFPLEAEANNNSFSASYSGTYDSSSPMSFDIYNVDIEQRTFTGHIYIKGELATINKDISGNIAFYDDYYECDFQFKYFLFTNYDAVFYIRIYPEKGIATGEGGGGIIIYSSAISLQGTVDKFYNKTFSYSEDDMKMCMELSKAMYSAKDEETIQEELGLSVSLFDYQVEENQIFAYNYTGDTNADNVAYGILNRKNSDNSIDLIVAIRGTYKDEWQGNTEITGTSYDPDKNVHDNFEKAKDSIKAEILNYYNEYCVNYDKVNLIITGHSRGAAVANLYAKNATDVKNDTVTDDKIPVFDNVTAYTFACPNVEKYNSSMEGYKNIFNFWFDTDIVPTVPLTEPTDGWNYWKYGRCYTMDISELKDWSFSIEKSHFSMYISGNINRNIKNELKDSFSQWTSVDDYYNKDLLIYNASIWPYTSLYNFLHNATYFFSSSNKIYGLSAINKLAYSPSLKPLICFALNNIGTIYDSHDYNTYNEIINGSYGSTMFECYSYEDALQTNISTCNDQIMAVSEESETNNSTITYDLYETSVLSAFANSDNNSILNWDLEDPSTWDGITWNNEGHVSSIDLSYKWLTGSLDCSDFTALENVNVYANLLTEIDLTGDSSLTSLNCSYNDFSQNGINLSDCTSLVELYCDGCGISTLNLSGLTELQTLSCAFNNLIALNIEDNTNLNHICCAYNYLDTHEGGSLYSNLYNYKAVNNAYINYMPQLLPNDAIIDENELQALEDFAKTGDNNSELDWLDDNGDISLDKVQNNAFFEFDGEKYRVIALDVSETDVEGSLNLSSFGELKAIYCEETKISSLDVSGCNKLETLWCEGCEITTLELPSNAGESTGLLCDVSCEYNYIDTSIFTEEIINNIESKTDYNLKYINQKGDSGALRAALDFANTLDEKDYSTSSFEALNDLLEECNSYNFDNLYLTQENIDELTSEVLSAVYDLKAYFDVVITGTNGTITINCNAESLNLGKHSLLYATEITLNATPDDGYTFAGWYDTVNNIYVSKNAEYTFKVSSNIKLKAVFIADGSSTLTFANYSNWIAGTVTKTTQEWAELTTIADLLPDVPYRYGYSNGRWVYNDADVLGRLQSGENVIITAEYDEDDTSLPEPPDVTDKPVLDLYYKYDSDNCVGSFVMAGGFPENIQVEEIGIAFYYKDANTFDPTDNFTLILNNKMLTSRFNTDTLEDIYIVNMNKMTSKYNWASRGYVTYRDGNNMVTVYSNQVNVVDRQDVLTTPFGLINFDNTGDNSGNKHNIDVIEGECD